MLGYLMYLAGTHVQLGAVLYVIVIESPGSRLTSSGGIAVAVDELHTV